MEENEQVQDPSVSSAHDLPTPQSSKQAFHVVFTFIMMIQYRATDVHLGSPRVLPHAHDVILSCLCSSSRCKNGCESDDRICDSSCETGEPYGDLGCNAEDGTYGLFCRTCYNDENEALAADSAENRAIM